LAQTGAGRLCRQSADKLKNTETALILISS
jgi:hypothetical protein